MPTTRGRLVFANQTVEDQADFYQADGFTRQTGILITDLTNEVFFNNGSMPWPLVDGTGVTGTQVAAGSVYFHEITPGFYSIRWRPNAVGYWRLIVSWATGIQELGQDYDVTLYGAGGGGGTCRGIKSSFIKPGDRP